MKTIQINDEMYDFLMELSKEINTQDNRCTAMPYFFQIQTKEQVAAYEGCGDEIWIDGECERELKTTEEINDHIIEYMVENEESFIENNLSEDEAKKQAKEIVEKMTDYDKDEWLENHEFRKINVTQVNKYENSFLTAKTCEEHIRKNHYHYREPRSYLQHAFRNYELEMVYKFLCGLTNKDIHKQNG